MLAYCVVGVVVLGKLDTIKAMTRRSTCFLMQREGAAGVSSREGSMEGSLRAVNRNGLCFMEAWKHINLSRLQRIFHRHKENGIGCLGF